MIDCDAWLLHKKPSGNTSARLTLFTREYGLLDCLFKGARSAKNAGLLQPFIPLWIQIKPGNHGFYLRKLECKAASLSLQDSNLFSALYLNELLYYSFKTHDPHPQLYDCYQQTLKKLSIVSEPLAIESLLRAFELMLLNQYGYSLNLAIEAQTNTPIIAENNYRFIAGKGLFATEEGLPGKDILALANGQLDQVSILKTAKIILRKAIAHLLDGRELKSRNLFSLKTVNHE